MAQRLMVLAGMLAAMLALAVPAMAQEASVTGVLEELEETKADGTVVYGLVDEVTGEAYFVETATGESPGDLAGQRVTAYGTVRNDSGRILTANRIELADAPQAERPAVGDAFSGFGVVESMEGGYGLNTGGGPGSSLYLEGDADFAAFEGQDVYVSGTITNDTPATLAVEVIEPAAEAPDEEISVTGVVEELGTKADGTVYYGLIDEVGGQGYAFEGDFDFASFAGQRVTATGIYEAGGGQAVLRVSSIEPTTGGTTTPGGTTMGGTTTGSTTAADQYEDGGTPEQAGIDLNEDGAVDETDGQFAVQTSDQGVSSTPAEGALPGTGGLILPVAGLLGAMLLVGGLLYYRKLAS